MGRVVESREPTKWLGYNQGDNVGKTPGLFVRHGHAHGCKLFIKPNYTDMFHWFEFDRCWNHYHTNHHYTTRVISIGKQLSHIMHDHPV